MDNDDLNTFMNNFSESLVKLSEYNDFIVKLSGDEYDDLKVIWDEMYSEYNGLYDSLVKNPPSLDNHSDELNMNPYGKMYHLYVKEIDSIFK